jgi:hypothetical protein
MSGCESCGRTSPVSWSRSKEGESFFLTERGRDEVGVLVTYDQSLAVAAEGLGVTAV